MHFQDVEVRASAMLGREPGYLQRSATNWAASFAACLSVGAGTSAPYTAARTATSGRLAYHRCSVEMCPLRMDFSRRTSAEMASMGI